MAASVTKNVFLTARQCMAKAWFDRNGAAAVDPPSEGDRFRMEQGAAVGALVRTLFGDGRLVADPDPASAATATAALMANPEVNTIFEATFVCAPYVAKADILRRHGSGWYVVEVKMSLEDTDGLPDLVDDLTYTVMVAKRCGTNVVRASLLLISRAYRRGMGPAQLFATSDQTEEVNERLPAFESTWEETERLTGGSVRPTPALCGQCRDCDYFDSLCLGRGVKHPVFSLPALHASKLLELSRLGVVGLDQLPATFKLTDNQRRVCDCVRDNRHHVSPSLASDLALVRWPAHYLDFETVMTPLPLYDGMPPFAQVTTQYSVHKCPSPGRVEDHREFLAEPTRDCERELAERLIHDLGDDGSIVVYSHFESVRVKALAKRFPDLADALERLLGRLFDLLPVVRKGFYHPAFGGSFSIKRTLPALVPGMTYDGMDIGDGDTAVARFAKMAMGRCSADEAKVVRADLLRYCKQDTLAMVKLHEALVGVAGLEPIPA
jgi:hypothetical protein